MGGSCPSPIFVFAEVFGLNKGTTKATHIFVFARTSLCYLVQLHSGLGRLHFTHTKKKEKKKNQILTLPNFLLRASEMPKTNHFFFFFFTYTSCASAASIASYALASPYVPTLSVGFKNRSSMVAPC